MTSAVYVIAAFGLFWLAWLASASDTRPQLLRRFAGGFVAILLAFLVISIGRGDFLSRSPNQDDAESCAGYPVC